MTQNEHLEDDAELYALGLTDPDRSPAIEAQKAMRALTNPTAAPSTAQTPAPTYKQNDQRELDRIINNQR